MGLLFNNTLGNIFWRSLPTVSSSRLKCVLGIPKIVKTFCKNLSNVQKSFGQLWLISSFFGDLQKSLEAFDCLSKVFTKLMINVC